MINRGVKFMQRKAVIGRCPVCETRLRVTELSCPSCRTKIVTDLQTCAFCNLSTDLLKFLKAFLRARGNIKEVERELGISYPTVRKRLDDLLVRLGLEAEESVAPNHRLDVFERLRRGEMSVEDALKTLSSEEKEE
jgi:hypothetical protein